MLELLKTEIVPSHIIIRKSSEYTLKDLDTAASAIKEIKKEFEVLEDYVDNHITNGVNKHLEALIIKPTLSRKQQMLQKRI